MGLIWDMEIDFLIIGQGLAGSAMGYLLQKEGYRVLLFDTPDQNQSSRIAAGLYNPVTGRKMVKTWMGEIIFPQIEPFYRELEGQTGKRFLNSEKIYRPFLSIEEQNEWMGHSSDPAIGMFIEQIFSESQFPELRDPFGGVLLKMSGWLNINEYLKGKVAPVFFGSAVNNFGVKEMLDTFIRIAPLPQSRETSTRHLDVQEDKFSGFIFKIHANLDPKHRDRIAFLRVCSGKFERNKYYHHVRLDKDVRFSNPYSFMARQKDVIEEAYPGDVVGLFDTGNFKIGDTLTEGEVMNFKGVPSFSPEHFRYINNADPMKAKQLEKGIDQLMDEGVAQLFTLEMNNRKIIGTVGALQYEVIQYRLEHEYGAKCTYENFPVHKACWVKPNDAKSDEFLEFKRIKQKFLATDKYKQLVFLADSDFTIQMTQNKFPNVKLFFTSEFD